MFFNDQRDTFTGPTSEMVREVVDSVMEDESSEENAEERSDEVERRILLAMHYREAMKSGIFDSNSAAAQTVNKEVADFLRERLEELLGMSNPKVKQVQAAQLPFSEQQLSVLLMLANKTLEKMSPPSPAKAADKLTPPELPTIEVKRKVMPNEPKVQKKDPPAQAARAAVQPAPQQQSKAKNTKTKTMSKSDIDNLPDGEPFMENGLKYVWARNENLTNEHGEAKRFKKPLSSQIGNPHAARNPTSKAEIEMMSLQHAQGAVGPKI